MSSEKRIAANRQNARRSTGPKTPEGKARSSHNALKHGLLSQDITLPEEKPEDFLELLNAYCDDLQPVGETEEFLVHEIATCQWRLERARRSDTGLWWSEMSEVRRYSSAPFDADNHDDTIYLEGLAFNRACHTFTLQARYEATIRRAYYRALDDLQRRQDRRAKQTPPAPAPADNLPESNRMQENYETNPPLPQPASPPAENEPPPSALGPHNARGLGLLAHGSATARKRSDQSPQEHVTTVAKPCTGRRKPLRTADSKFQDAASRGKDEEVRAAVHHDSGGIEARQRGGAGGIGARFAYRHL